MCDLLFKHIVIVDVFKVLNVIKEENYRGLKVNYQFYMYAI